MVLLKRGNSFGSHLPLRNVRLRNAQAEGWVLIGRSARSLAGECVDKSMQRRVL